MKARAQSQKSNKQDKIYTPECVAKFMVNLCPIIPGQSVLDPCCGQNRVFINNFPHYSRLYLAEIEHPYNIDFLKLDGYYDWIIGNPPYSIWDQWVDKTVQICNNFCYIMNFLNFTHKRIDRILKAGFGITRMHVLKVDWWFSPSIIVVFQKNQESIISVTPETVKCECGKRCQRGRNGASMNECSLQGPGLERLTPVLL